jgi:hypothetical protein
MTIPQFRKLSQEINPIIPITVVPTTASLADMARALSKNKSEHKRIIGLPNINLRNGEVVELRLDIPAYELYNVWVNAIHIAGQRNMYSNTSVGNNAIFGDSKAHTKALKIATGTSKGPFARIAVSWENQTVEQTEQEISRALEDSQQPNSTWKQIGFNPSRSGYFYDKANLKPVASASRVLQLGPLVMAQNVQYAPTEEANVNFSPRPQIPDIPQEHFEYRNRKSHIEGLTDKDLKGKFNKILLDSMSGEGLKVLSEKGIPFGVVWLEEDGGWGGYWAADRDVIAISIKPTIINGRPVKGELERAALHEYGHMVMNRLFRMLSMTNEDVRYDEGTGRIYHDITDFTPEFEAALKADAQALGLSEGLSNVDPILNEKAHLLIKGYIKDSQGSFFVPKPYDGRLDGYYDIIDAMTRGEASDVYHLYGHGESYYAQGPTEINDFGNYVLHETAANMFEAKYNKDQIAWNYMKENLPNLVQTFDSMMAKYDGQTKFINDEAMIVQRTHARSQYL